MQVSEQNGQLCVEIDTGSMFSDYLEFIKGEDLTPEIISRLKIRNDLQKVLTNSFAIESGKWSQFAKSDPMKVTTPSGGENDVRNFPLPRQAGDGSCDLKSGPSFLNDVDAENCALKVQSFSQACSNDGALSALIWNNLRYLKGSANFSPVD